MKLIIPATFESVKVDYPTYYEDYSLIHSVMDDSELDFDMGIRLKYVVGPSLEGVLPTFRNLRFDGFFVTIFWSAFNCNHPLLIQYCEEEYRYLNDDKIIGSVEPYPVKSKLIKHLNDVDIFLRINYLTGYKIETFERGINEHIDIQIHLSKF